MITVIILLYYISYAYWMCCVCPHNTFLVALATRQIGSDEREREWRSMFKTERKNLIACNEEIFYVWRFIKFIVFITYNYYCKLIFLFCSPPALSLPSLFSHSFSLFLILWINNFPSLEVFSLSQASPPTEPRRTRRRADLSRSIER